MTHKGWRVVKPQHNQYISPWEKESVQSIRTAVFSDQPVYPRSFDKVYINIFCRLLIEVELFSKI